MRKVAAYCRVSTDKEDQANSFDSQCRFFRDYVSNQPGWVLYDIYADEGISGTTTKKRFHFNRMIQDAYAGKFDLVITKEVSRFSRNILDTIRYTRELKALGIGVIFMTDGCSTMDPDAELRLSIMGSIAQEESRKTSARVKWGQTRQMERGVVFGHSMLGYDVANGKMNIDPAGAELVRLIFYKYAVEKKGINVISRELRQAGYQTTSGGFKWSSSYLIKILKNEKYVGDLIQKKTYTPDYLSHAKKRNHGAEELVIIHDHHEPIIDRTLWSLAQEELEKNNKHNQKYCGHSKRYIFSGKIKCGECGASFVSRQKTLHNGHKVRRWSCATAVREGSKHTEDDNGNPIGCDVGRLLRDDDAVQMLQDALKALQIDRRAIIASVSSAAISAIRTDDSIAVDTVEKLQYEIEKTEKKKENVLDSFFSGDISKEEMQSLKKRYDLQLKDLYNQLRSIREDDGKAMQHSIRKMIEETLLTLLNGEKESEVFYKNILERVTVFKDRHMELSLKHLPQVYYFSEQFHLSKCID